MEGKGGFGIFSVERLAPETITTIKAATTRITEWGSSSLWHKGLHLQDASMPPAANGANASLMALRVSRVILPSPTRFMNCEFFASPAYIMQIQTVP